MHVPTRRARPARVRYMADGRGRRIHLRRAGLAASAKARNVTLPPRASPPVSRLHDGSPRCIDKARPGAGWRSIQRCQGPSPEALVAGGENALDSPGISLFTRPRTCCRLKIQRFGFHPEVDASRIAVFPLLAQHAERAAGVGGRMRRLRGRRAVTSSGRTAVWARLCWQATWMGLAGLRPQHGRQRERRLRSRPSSWARRGASFSR